MTLKDGYDIIIYCLYFINDFPILFLNSYCFIVINCITNDLGRACGTPTIVGTGFGLFEEHAYLQE